MKVYAGPDVVWCVFGKSRVSDKWWPFSDTINRTRSAAISDYGHGDKDEYHRDRRACVAQVRKVRIVPVEDDK